MAWYSYDICPPLLVTTADADPFLIRLKVSAFVSSYHGFGCCCLSCFWVFTCINVFFFSSSHPPFLFDVCVFIHVPCVCMAVFIYVSLCTTCIQCPWRPEKDIIFPGTGVTDICEPPYGCWNLNLGPPQEQQEFLTPRPSILPWATLCFDAARVTLEVPLPRYVVYMLLYLQLCW